MKKAVTLSDIAKKTGYSVNTVSHALKDKKDISEQTKAYILQTAEEMGYIGNASASFMRSGVSRSIAIILGDISNPHFSIMVKEIESYIKSLGYTSFILNTDEDEQLERQAIVSSLGKNVDGIILCPVQKSDENVRFLIESGVPFTLIGRYFKSLDTSYVVCNDEQGGYLAAEHLIKNGHRKILFLNGPSYISSAWQRMVGVKKALEAYKIPFGKSMIYHIPVKVGESEKQIQKIINNNIGCTALICFSDMIAWETAYVLKTMGIKVPEDISLVGFDNIQSRFLFPMMLTTISSSKLKMSQKAADLLFKTIQSGEKGKIVLETKLIVRESTRNIESELA